MDIKERLRLEIAAGARGEWVADHCFKQLLSDALAEIEALDPDPVVCGCREAMCPHTPFARLPRQQLVDHFRERIKELTAQLKYHTEQRGFKEIPHG